MGIIKRTTKAAMADMNVIYTRDEMPDQIVKSIFLAGPTPRDKGTQSWRPEALKLLADMGYDGTVFVPEYAPDHEDDMWEDYKAQCEWERRSMNMSDVILFWVPRDMEFMPAMTTNVEFGTWLSSGKVVYGRPEDADRVRYLDRLAKERGMKVYSTLEATLKEAVDIVGDGSLRWGGERNVPLQIWDTEMFQGWYVMMQAAGNRLDEARQLWVFEVPGKGIFSYVLWVKIWIEDEQRFKENEWIFSRRDISTAVLYEHPVRIVDPFSDMFDITVVLVREFRSTARNDDGMIVELPGGSVEHGENAADAVAHEVSEETGLELDGARFKRLDTRQVCATLSTHVSHLFSCELTKEEMDVVEKAATRGDVHGVEEDTERTYLQLSTVDELLKDKSVDWSTLGMVVKAVSEEV